MLNHQITLDQEAYIEALKPIIHEDLKLFKPTAEEPEGPEVSFHLQQLYMSLLGAVAWVLQTRVDLAVYVSALQRHSGKAQAIHVKRLSSVVRYAQRHKRRLTYRRLKAVVPSGAAASQVELRAIVDSAFRKEDTSGHAVRGAVFLRCAPQTSNLQPGTIHEDHGPLPEDGERSTSSDRLE